MPTVPRHCLRMKNVTIQDIANEAGVSKSTVSRVLNNTAVVDSEKREAIEGAMSRLHFKPSVVARSLSKGHSMTVGVITQNIGSPFYDTLYRDLENLTAAVAAGGGLWDVLPSEYPLAAAEPGDPPVALLGEPTGSAAGPAAW